MTHKVVREQILSSQQNRENKQEKTSLQKNRVNEAICKPRYVELSYISARTEAATLSCIPG